MNKHLNTHFPSKRRRENKDVKDAMQGAAEIFAFEVFNVYRVLNRVPS